MKLKLTIGAWQLDIEGDQEQIAPHADRFYRLCEELARVGKNEAAAAALGAAGPKVH